jgi:hypothetical protein
VGGRGSQALVKIAGKPYAGCMKDRPGRSGRKALLKCFSLAVPFVCALGCGTPESSHPDDDTDDLAVAESRSRYEERQDSDEVGYYNPNTGYTADYTLPVEYDSDGEVERINFPNGGWEDDFTSQERNYDGTITVTDEDGREFTVSGSDD